MPDRRIAHGVIPPEANAEFVARREEVLDTYARPCDAVKPVLCLDAQLASLRVASGRPVQLLREPRTPIPVSDRASAGYRSGGLGRVSPPPAIRKAP